MTTPPTPEVLLFDVMGTLVYDPFYVEMPAFFHMSLDELIAQNDPTAWIEFERGEIDGDAFLDRFFADKRAYDREGLLECMRSSYRWLQGMEELLAQLHSGGFKIVALSNYSTWYRMIEERLGLSRYLTWDLVSCHTGWRKPDTGAFHDALERLAVPAEVCLFVDDREDNCRAAREVGIRALEFRNADELRHELRAQAGMVVGETP